MSAPNEPNNIQCKSNNTTCKKICSKSSSSLAYNIIELACFHVRFLEQATSFSSAFRATRASVPPRTASHKVHYWLMQWKSGSMRLILACISQMIMIHIKVVQKRAAISFFSYLMICLKVTTYITSSISQKLQHFDFHACNIQLWLLVSLII